MRLSLATRIFLGYAVVLVTFGAVSMFSVAEMHRNQLEIRLVSDVYFKLSQDTAIVERLHDNHQADTRRLVAEENPRTRRALIHLVRQYFPEVTSKQLTQTQQTARQGRDTAPVSEVGFLKDVDQRLTDLGRRYVEYQELAEGVFVGLEADSPDWPEVRSRYERLKQSQTAIGKSIRLLHDAVERRIRERVGQANLRERRTGLAIIGLSVLAIAVGLLATAWSARTLRPVRTLIEGVSRIGRGDYSAQLGLTGDDEISILAREFDQLARSLKEREAQLKDKQEALLRAEQLAAVGRISAQVAHEVRNPLSSIGLNVEMIDDVLARASFSSPEEAKEARELLASVLHEVDRLTEITEEYLKMARLPQPSLAAEDVNALLDQVLDFTREELARHNVEVVRELDPEQPRALADEGQLRQVLLNLVRNSREAMSGSGGGRLVVRSRAVNGAVEIVVADTGCGMSGEVKEHIFEPFFSTKTGGTGLGLAVSRQIVQAHGGSIECESRPGGGTTFVVKLPRPAA